MIGAAIRPYLAACALALVVGAIGTAYLKGRADGAAVAESRAMQATIEQLRERGLINEAVRDASDCDLIIELGGVCDDAGQ